MRDIGKNIRDLRMKQNMTQDELAEKLFVTRQTVSNYETGRSRPDIDMLASIAQALSTDANTLLYGPAPSPNIKAALLKLIPAVVAAIAATVVYSVLYSHFDYLAGRYFNTMPRLWLGALGKPLVYLIYGWTVMQALSILLKGPYISPEKARRIRIGLFVVLTLYILFTVSFLIFAPLMTETNAEFVWGWSMVFYTILGARAGQNSMHLYLLSAFLIGILFRLCGITSGKNDSPKETLP